MSRIPLPGDGEAVVAVPAPGHGEGWWAGASSAALDDDGSFVIAYRTRTGHAGRGSTVVARSEDGEHLTTVAASRPGPLRRGIHGAAGHRPHR